MSPPTSVPFNTVWLGRISDSDAYYPTIGPAHTQRLGVFPPKVTTGDNTKDSDQYLSSWVISDLTGGAQILKLNEGTDDARFYDSELDTRYPNQTALPPLVLSRAGGGSASYPLGMIYSDADGLSKYFVAANGTALLYFNGSTWTSVGLSLSGAPLGKGVPYRGLGTSTDLFVPLGANGYNLIKITSGTTFAIAHGTDIHPRCFAHYDGKLMALGTNGKLYGTVDSSTTFTEELDATGDELVLDPSYAPQHLISYFDRAGNPALYAITDRAAFIWNDVVSKWQLTTLIYPPHPDMGQGVDVFRSGENLWISAGLDVLSYSSSNVLSPLQGLSRGNGVPADSRGHIVDLQAEQSCLYAITTPDTATGATKARLAGWTGQGWHYLWSANEAPTWMGISTSDPAGDGTGYALHWGTSSRLYSMKLRRNFLNPLEGFAAGVDHFAESGYLESGRFDANMRGFDKLADRVDVFCDNATSTETIAISYRTDATYPTYTALGTVTASGKSTFYFDPDGDGFAEGQIFNWIQFRLAFSRGSTVTQTPIMEALAMIYQKVPQDTNSWVFSVGLPPDEFIGHRTPDTMIADLNDLNANRQFLVFVHQDQQYRVMLASVGGNDDTGEDHGGGRQVNVIQIGPMAT